MPVMWRTFDPTKGLLKEEAHVFGSDGTAAFGRFDDTFCIFRECGLNKGLVDVA